MKNYTEDEVLNLLGLQKSMLEQELEDFKKDCSRSFDDLLVNSHFKRMIKDMVIDQLNNSSYVKEMKEWKKSLTETNEDFRKHQRAHNEMLEIYAKAIAKTMGADID